MNANIKQCLACKEDIKAEALKCRYCQQVQAQAANLINNPAFNFFLTAVLGVFIIWVAYSIILLFIEEPQQPIFEITETTMFLTEVDKDVKVRCIGKIKNPYPTRWNDFTLQATFKNTDKQIIDVLYSEPEVSIYPLFHFEGIVSGTGSASKSEYTSCELSVVNADDY